MAAACLIKCGAKATYPLPNDSYTNVFGAGAVCYGNCMNINLEKGPYLRDLGDIPEGSIPKKFIWANNISKDIIPEKYKENRLVEKVLEDEE